MGHSRWDKNGLFPDGNDTGRFPWFWENFKPREAPHQPIYCKTSTPCLPEECQMPFWPETSRQGLPLLLHPKGRRLVANVLAAGEPGSVSGVGAVIPLPTQAREIPGTAHTPGASLSRWQPPRTAQTPPELNPASFFSWPPSLCFFFYSPLVISAQPLPPHLLTPVCKES